MKVMKHLLLPGAQIGLNLALICLITCGPTLGCSSGELGSSQKTAKEADSATAANAPADGTSQAQSNETTDNKAVVPQQVSGAFLTYCSQAGFQLAGSQVVASGDLLSCLVKDKNGNPLAADLSGVQATMTDASGNAKQPDVILAAKGEVWSFHIQNFSTMASSVKADFLISINAASTPAPVRNIVQDFNFQWWKDPLFATVLDIVRAFSRPSTIKSAPADAKHLAFVSDKAYTGNLSATADKACATEGATIDASRTWVALLSTSARAARDKITIRGPVYNAVADLIAADATEFWSANHRSENKITPTGKSTNGLYESDGAPQFINRIWTGSGADGKLDATSGNCSDWSSEAKGQSAAIGAADKRDGNRWSAARSSSCAQLARLFCISQ